MFGSIIPHSFINFKHCEGSELPAPHNPRAPRQAWFSLFFYAPMRGFCYAFTSMPRVRKANSDVPRKGNAPPARSRELLARSCERRIKFCERRIKFCERRIKFCEPRKKFCEPRIKSCEPRIKSCEPRIKSYERRKNAAAGRVRFCLYAVYLYVIHGFDRYVAPLCRSPIGKVLCREFAVSEAAQTR